MDILNRIFKLVLLPGSIQFLVVSLVIGVALLYGRDRTRRLGRYWLTALADAYLAMSLPVGADVLVVGLARGFGSGSPRPATQVEPRRSSSWLVAVTGTRIRTVGWNSSPRRVLCGRSRLRESTTCSPIRW